jgi:thiol-disulfide isomerase/thioredoxin
MPLKMQLPRRLDRARLSTMQLLNLRVPVSVLLVGLLAAMLAACGGQTTDPAATETPATTETPAATEAPKADADLAYSFPVTMFQGQDEVGGDMVELGGLLGKQPIVINFWAGLCPPCRAEMPDFQAFYEDFNDRVLLLGIDLGQFTGLGTQQDATDLLADLQVTYPAGFTDDGDVIKEYRVLGMPSTIFIDANGEVFDTWTGPLNEETLKEKTLEMLEQ